MSNLSTEFELPVVTRSKASSGARNLKIDHTIPNTPIWGGLSCNKLGLSRINLCTKFEVSICTRSKGTKGDEKNFKLVWLAAVTITQCHWNYYQSTDHKQLSLIVL